MTYSEFEDTLYENINNISDINESYSNLSIQDSTRLHLTNYLIIRSCGTIEQGIKLLISNHFSSNITDSYVLNFIEESIIKSSANPSKHMVATLLNKFDSSKKIDKLYPNYPSLNIDQLYSSLHSLKKLRNQIAHGDRVNISSNIINQYLDNSIILLLIIKEVLEKNYI